MTLLEPEVVDPEQDASPKWTPYPHAPEAGVGQEANPEWGQLSESSTVTLRGQPPIRVNVYFRPIVGSDGGKWVLFTSVNADTNKVMASEMSPSSS